MDQFKNYRKLQHLLIWTLIFLGLYLTSLYSYPLFHSLAEFFSIAIACGIFMIAWNSRQFFTNHYLLFIGIAYLFVAGVDLIHTLAYKGMGVFQGYETNLATQLWIAARYVQSLSLLIAPLFFRRKLKINFAFFGYAVAISLLLISIFYWDIFPICFIEGGGLTPFKKISEYIISLILLGAISHLLMNRKEFDKSVLRWVVWSIGVTIASELAFTFYIHAYGFSNLIGHYFKILSFYFIYKALIETSLSKPYNLLFRNLKQSEEALRESSKRIDNILSSISDGFFTLDNDLVVTYFNSAACRLLGRKEGEVLGRKIFDAFPEARGSIFEEKYTEAIRNKKDMVFELYFGVKPYVNWYDVRVYPLEDGISVYFQVTTERKRAEEVIVHLASFPQLNPNPIVEVDLTGYVSYFNSAAKQLFPDLPSMEIIHPWLEGLESLAMMLQKDPQTFHTREMRIGNVWYGQTIYYTPEWNRIRIYGSDITERKQMEEELRQSRDELEIRVQERTVELEKAYKELEDQSRILDSFFKFTITPLVLLDRNFNFIRVNEAYAKGCQRDISEFAGRNHFELYPHEENEAIFRRVVETKEPFQAFAKPFTFLDHPEWGTTYWDWILTPIFGNKGEVEYLVFALEDVTDRTRATDKLEEQANLLELAHDAIITCDMDGTIRFWNHGAEEIYGWTKEEAAGKASHTLLQTEFPKPLDEIVIDLIWKGRWEGELVHTRRDGKEITVASRWALQRDGKGIPVGILEINNDITERKRAEEAVKAERQRSNDVLEMLPAYLVLLTPDHHVSFANRFFRERFGESYGRRCFEYLFGRSEPCEICETYTVLKSMGPHEWEWTGPDGRNYYIYDFPFTDTDGSTLILEMGIDITERKRAEEVLKATSLYARSLIEAGLDPLVTISKEGKVTDVNRATALVTGAPRDELIGSDFSEYFTEPQKAREGYQEVFLKGMVRDYPLAIRHKSGPVTEVLYNATVYKNEAGEVQGVFAAARDVTERNETERRTNATNALLNLFVKIPTRKEYLDAVVELVQSWCRCRCAGIRVLDRNGCTPYESYRGFSQDFWESENWLSIQNDQCVCIRVVRGELDPQEAPIMTPNGSFCCGNTVKFVEALPELEKSRYRGVCIKKGFLSVGIIPIRYRGNIIGAIHLADEAEGRMNFKSVEFIETMAPLIGEAVNRFNLEDEVRDSENRLRLLSSQLLTVQENERRQVARDLHDGIGQMLSAIKFKIEDTLQKKGKGRAKLMAEDIHTLIPMIRGSIEEVRKIQMDLRPSTLDDLGIVATISWFCREFQKIYSTIHIEKQLDVQENEIAAQLKTVAYRILQEAMNNIAKHSKANLIRLAMRRRGRVVELVIEDNGIGFDLENYRKGFGLESMKERAELSGGTFRVESTKEKGTTITAQWPI